MPFEPYRDAGRELMAQAAAELAAGDARQASEKGWGAAAQMVKAVAEKRGWPHKSHPSLYDVSHRLARETGDEEIALLFHLASDLHTNFYENWLSQVAVETLLRRVETLLDKLEPLL